MASKNELKKINIKNRTCYYLDDIINVNDLNLDKILIDEKSCKNILNCKVAYKTQYRAMYFFIIFDKLDGYIRKHDSTKYLALFQSDQKYKRIIDRIRYLVMLKSRTSDFVLIA